MALLPRELFRRLDESPDENFYREPRLVTHIDDATIAALTQVYRESVRAGADVLDLMSSWVSHLPPEIAYGRVVPSYTDWSYELQAAGGQPLRIAAIGDGAADIDMEVYDENNNLVCRDYDGDATPVCAMTPAWTGVFSAKIINKTGAATYVRLISN